jgi:FkbH-like protein
VASNAGVGAEEASETPERRGSSLPALAAPVKAVIWDLDDTLWAGTLSEEEVQLGERNADIVRSLNRRGIVSSICSKNDRAKVCERLQREGLWEEFVFASIDWTPKGTRIAQLVSDMQLRAPNVLFVDDNPANLREALHYVPGLQVVEVDALAGLLDRPQLAGKPDPDLTRLQRYRILESKLADRERASGSNEDFLRSCDIRVTMAPAAADDAARVMELVNRANQLNFTKSRLTRQQYDALLADPERRTGYVRVQDRYGDYGVAGFYSVRDGRATDLVFSCRILNMGVEQWVHRQLGAPAVSIVGDVASSLSEPPEVDWIRLDDDSAQPSAARVRARRGRAGSRVMLKGGCDLSLLNGFLGGSIKTEFTYTSDTGAEVHADHTEILRRSVPETVTRHGREIDRLPFLDRAAFGSRVARRPRSFGTLIYSVLMDYTQGLYRLRDSDFVVPHGQFDVDATDPANWEGLAARWGHAGIDEPFLTWFSQHFEFEGALGAEALQENIRWLRRLLPEQTKLILLNGAEVPDVSPLEVDRHLRHRRMNAALDEVMVDLPETEICDVRTIVVAREDVTDNIRHYKRGTYLRIAERLRDMVGEGLGIEQRPFAMRVHRGQRKLARRIERAAVRFTLR